MKRILAAMMFTALLLVSCGSEPNTTESSGSSVETSVTESSESAPESSSAKTSEVSEESEEVSETASISSEVSESESSGSNSAESSVISGAPVPCTEHTLSYHSIPSTLTQLVDADEYYEWSEALFAESDTYNRSGEEFTVIAFVQHFNISREDFTAATRDWMTDEKMQNLGTTQEEYLAEYGYTDQQIDAIYSGDQAQINAAFCGDMAYYSETDGQLYSIYWLSDHTAEDYSAAGLPETEVTRILDAAESAGGQYAALAETATVQAQAYAE